MLEAVVTARAAAATATATQPLQALIFDSHYDVYKGVIAYVRVVNGEVEPARCAALMSTGIEFEPVEIGVFSPYMKVSDELAAGEVGYIATGLKTVRECRVGDTITLRERGRRRAAARLQTRPSRWSSPGSTRSRPKIIPICATRWRSCKLNDASLVYQPENIQALGFGFRVGFLGLFHMDIIQERLEREYDLDILATAPSVEYQVKLTNGETIDHRQPGRAARRDAHRRGARAVDEDPDLHAGRVHRADHGAGHQEARQVRQHGVSGPHAGDAHLA